MPSFVSMCEWATKIFGIFKMKFWKINCKYHKLPCIPYMYAQHAPLKKSSSLVHHVVLSVWDESLPNMIKNRGTFAWKKCIVYTEVYSTSIFPIWMYSK